MYQGRNTLRINQVCKEKGFLIAAHRGSVGGNIIQNSFLAYKTALLHGADLVEMDLSRSSDGVFYAFHNGVEQVIWQKDCDIREMTSQEIDNMYCYNDLSLVTKRHVQRAADVLEKLRNKCFINIDRSWYYWADSIKFLDSLDMSDQIILKSPVEDQLLEHLQDCGSKIMYMPIIKTVTDWEKVKSYNVNVVAAEVIIDSPTSNMLNPKFIKRLKDDGVLLWANTIVLDDTVVLSGLMDDNTSIEKGFDEGWGKILNHGFNILQTDWPGLVNNYRKTYNSKF
ncbi:MAG: glycerophosphodiester phosphodiesterase family protein [Pleomorphochaeta sp.]